MSICCKLRHPLNIAPELNGSPRLVSPFPISTCIRHLQPLKACCSIRFNESGMDTDSIIESANANAEITSVPSGMFTGFVLLPGHTRRVFLSAEYTMPSISV